MPRGSQSHYPALEHQSARSPRGPLQPPRLSLVHALFELLLPADRQQLCNLQVEFNASVSMSVCLQLLAGIHNECRGAPHSTHRVSQIPLVGWFPGLQGTRWYRKARVYVSRIAIEWCSLGLGGHCSHGSAAPHKPSATTIPNLSYLVS